MDSPFLDAPRPPCLSPQEREFAAALPTIERTGRTPRAGVVIIAGFGNPVAADYAAFVSQNSPTETLVVDEPVRQRLSSSVRSMSVAEFSRSTASPGGHRDRALSECYSSPHVSRETNAVSWMTSWQLPTAHRRDLSVSSARFDSILTTPTSSPSRTTFGPVAADRCTRHRLSSGQCPEPALARAGFSTISLPSFPCFQND